jgi:hypothetical protein
MDSNDQDNFGKFEFQGENRFSGPIFLSTLCVGSNNFCIDTSNFQMNFADFIHSMPQTSVAELDVVTSVKEKATTAYDLDGANKADPDDGVPQPAGPSFWSFEFYKQLFDVNTQQITDRIVNSMVPRSGQNYLEAFIKPKADLYGLRILVRKQISF